MFKILRNCVTVARQTLTLFVGVRIPIPQPTSSTEKDIGAENPETTTVSGFFHADF